MQRYNCLVIKCLNTISINYYIYVHRDKETTKKSNSFVAT